jgi:hypothetical protein
MTPEELASEGAAEVKYYAIKHGAALLIRLILDAAREELGPERWDETSIEDDILTMATERRA